MAGKPIPDQPRRSRWAVAIGGCLWSAPPRGAPAPPPRAAFASARARLCRNASKMTAGPGGEALRSPN
eukprot:15101097-Alexandrium_andersonii.AAC.1